MTATDTQVEPAARDVALLQARCILAGHVNTYTRFVRNVSAQLMAVAAIDGGDPNAAELAIQGLHAMRPACPWWSGYRLIRELKKDCIQ